MKQITQKNSLLATPVYAISVFVFLLVVSCASKKEMPKWDTVVDANPKLIFLNYTITEDTQGFKSVGLISKTITEGKLKSSGNKYVKTGKIGDLKCSQLDIKSQTLRNIFIKNPLNKSIEFINDSLKFESKALKIKKTSFSLRLQLHPKTESIVISEVIDSSLNVMPLSKNKIEKE